MIQMKSEEAGRSSVSVYEIVYGTLSAILAATMLDVPESIHLCM